MEPCHRNIFNIGVSQASSLGFSSLEYAFLLYSEPNSEIYHQNPESSCVNEHAEVSCSTWCTGLSVLLQDVTLVAATAVGAPDVGTCVLAQLARVELTLIHILLLLHRVGSFICGTDGEGLFGELAV